MFCFQIVNLQISLQDILKFFPPRTLRNCKLLHNPAGTALKLWIWKQKRTKFINPTCLQSLIGDNCIPFSFWQCERQFNFMSGLSDVFILDSLDCLFDASAMNICFIDSLIIVGDFKTAGRLELSCRNLNVFQRNRKSCRGDPRQN